MRRRATRCSANYWVVFLSDATATYDNPNRGIVPMPNADVHPATLDILAASTAHVMSVAEMSARPESAHNPKNPSS